MNKKIKAVLLLMVLCLSLPYLYLFVSGAIVGSFEWFPSKIDIAMKRLIYTTISALILLTDIFISVKLIRLIRR